MSIIKSHKNLLIIFIILFYIFSTPYGFGADNIKIVTKGDAINGERVLKECKNEKNVPYTCYSGNFVKLLKSNGIEVSLATFKYVSDKTNGIYGACNNIGRELGRESYKIFGDKSLSYHASVCGPSYAYGAMIEYGLKNPKDSGGEFLKKYCLSDSNPAACAYGLGISMSAGSKKGIEVQGICDKAFKSIINNQDPLYEHSATGLCVLGWVSGKVSTLPKSNFSTIEKSADLCRGMKAPALESCTGEAIFAYTYVGVSTTPERLTRVENLKKYCDKKPSKICSQFVGKAFNDYLLYSYMPDYSKKSDVKYVADKLYSLCGGKMSNSCLYGFMTAQLTHTSYELTNSVCNMQRASIKKECQGILSKIGHTI